MYRGMTWERTVPCWLGLLLTLGGCKRASIAAEPTRDESQRVPARRSATPSPGPSTQAPASATASASAAPAPSAPRADSLLLITVDTLRADQSWSGYEGAKTPVLEGLVRRSVLWERAYAVANTTMPSLSSLMMARYPTELPRDECGLPAFWGSETLAEALTGAGIHGAGFHGHPIFAGAFAPSRGFAEWRLVKEALGRKATSGAVTGADIAAEMVQFLRHNPPGRRFFAWAHFVDPHDSYVRHRDFPPGPSPRRGLYDGEVSYTDAQIGKVLAALEETGLGASTAVLVTADHGEAFGEHERFRHGHTLYEEEIRVPLILHVPGLTPARIAEPRSLIDVARTAAELLQVQPPSPWRGVSLLRDLEGPPAPRPVLIDAPPLVTMTGQRAVLQGKDKVWWRGNSAMRLDLARDPAEQSQETLLPGAAPLLEAQRLFQAIPQVPAKPCYRGG